MPAWHPNFRNPAQLPDTKAIRTSFFTNGLAIFIVLVLVGYASYREYELYSLRSDTANALDSIHARKPVSDQAIVLYKKFQEEEKKVLALQEFLATSRIVMASFILQLGEGIPPSITLSSIDYRPAGVTLRGGIVGAPEEASGRAIAYVENLRKNESFAKLFDNITLTNIARDQVTGLIQFVIDLKLKGAPAPLAGGKK